MASPSQPSPAIPPPPGQSFDPIDPVSLWKWDVLCVTICLFFTTIMFLLRSYARAFVKRQWLFEDYMVCVGYAGFVVYCAFMTTVMDRYGGIHEWDLTVPEVQVALYWFNVTSIEYGLEMMVTKLTILMLYRRVFILPHRWTVFDIILRLFESVIVLFYVAISIVKIFECTPRERIWNKSIPGTCTNVSTILTTSGLFNFITDVLILLVPIKSVWNMHMKRTKKWQVVAVFTVGLIAPVFSMIGFVVRLEDSGSPDQTYNQPLVLLWGTAEVTTGIICVCLPPLVILLRSRNSGPTASIINGSARTHGFRKRPLRDMSKFDEEYLELRDGSAVGIEAPPAVVAKTGEEVQIHTIQAIGSGMPSPAPIHPLRTVQVL